MIETKAFLEAVIAARENNTKEKKMSLKPGMEIEYTPAARVIRDDGIKRTLLLVFEKDIAGYDIFYSSTYKTGAVDHFKGKSEEFREKKPKFEVGRTYVDQNSYRYAVVARDDTVGDSIGWITSPYPSDHSYGSARPDTAREFWKEI